MRLIGLHLDNFRGFAELSIQFDRHVTLLLGGNGAGKTALLEAITVAFGAFFAALEQSPDRAIDASDARRSVFDFNGIADLQEQWPVRVAAAVEVPDFAGSDELLFGWARTRASKAGRTTWADERHVRAYAQWLQLEVQHGRPTALPLFAYYGTQRLWREKRLTEARLGIGTRFDGYIDCLDVGASQRTLGDWMYKKTQIELQRREREPEHRDPQLAAVTSAVCASVDGASRFWFDLTHQELRFARGASVESFSMLSDGYRNMVAMVADIAERAAVLNPHLGVDAARETAGIVLIDEIELHLHPRWQQTVLPNLRRVFPNLQFIATTHSPQVVATVARHQVRLLRDNALIATDLYVEGRDASELLEDVFGVPARPSEAQQRIDELFMLLDTQDYAAARVRLCELQAILGSSDADLVRARWVLESEAGVEDTSTATP